MKAFSVSVSRSLALLALLLFCSALSLGTSFQEKGKQEKVSDAERKAAQKIDEAKDTAAKIAAASEFVNKYPKSTLRPKIAEMLVNQISGTQDAAQKITLAESYLGTFSEASETKPIYPVLIQAYISAKRVDDAFNAAAPWLEQQCADDEPPKQRRPTRARRLSPREATTTTLLRRPRGAKHLAAGADAAQLA